MTGEFRHRNLALLLLQAREALMTQFRPILKTVSLTEQQWRIIRALNENEPCEMEIGQIASECCILSPSLSGILERMEAAGLVRRHRVAADQRKVMVSLTPNSERIIKRISPLLEERYRAIDQHIGNDALRQVYRSLDDLAGMLPSVGKKPREVKLPEA